MKQSLSFDTDTLKPLMTDDFVLGIATSSYQIEGATTAGGRTDSVWDTFCRKPGNIADQSTGEVACDHYQHWQEDVALLVELGVEVYRFSISWSRVFPDDSGVVNEEGLSFYRRLAEALRSHGIRPMVTLHHWDLPQYLQDRGGWQNRDTALRFAEYAAAVATGLGSSVDFYTTINEPWCIVHLGHRTGVHAPGLRDQGAAVAATHHLLLAHGLAMQALRERAPSAELGIVLNGGPSYPYSESNADAEAASILESEQIHRFAAPILSGHYPQDFQSQVATYMRPGDLETIAAPCDYLGWNYYTRNLVKPGENGVPEIVTGQDYPLTEMGWEVYPEGLREVISILREHYDVPPLYVSENGAAFEDQLDGETVHDPDRFHYIQRHLQVITDMVQSGVDIRGYICWTLLDNFEWAEGCSKRFGLVHVDFDTQERVIKDSGKAYANLNADKARIMASPREKRIDCAR
ncbi:MAG: GH1 family beta-glucosidase [Xanthomonadales bacterium]|nr:GH1 family beta-glucosidase [Xanthomonadales bacterium]